MSSDISTLHDDQSVSSRGCPYLMPKTPIPHIDTGTCVWTEQLCIERNIMWARAPGPAARHLEGVALSSHANRYTRQLHERKPLIFFFWMIKLDF